jgi:di/tripeptidase
MMIYKKFVSVDNPQQTMFHLDANSCEMNNKIGCSNLAYDYHNGIGVAAAMALLDMPDTVELPPLECLFTVDEETGLTGAFELEEGFFEGLSDHPDLWASCRI